MDEKLLLKPPCPSTTHESSEASGGSPTNLQAIEDPTSRPLALPARTAFSKQC